MLIWITGKSGLVGSSLLVKCPLPVVATGHHEVDITKQDEVSSFVREHQPTHIINCAAFTQVDLAEKQPRQAMAANRDGPAHLAEAANEVSAYLIHLSTDYVFGNKPSRHPYREQDMPAPVNLYGQSKLEGEQKVLEISSRHCIVRPSWIFGKQGKNFISQVLHWMKDREEIQVVQDQVSRPTFAEDLAEMLIRFIHLKPAGIYHFANKGICSRFDIASALYEWAIKNHLPIKCRKIAPIASEHFPAAAPRPSFSALSTEKIEQLLQMPLRHWKDTLDGYLSYLS